MIPSKIFAKEIFAKAFKFASSSIFVTKSILNVLWGPKYASVLIIQSSARFDFNQVPLIYLKFNLSYS